MKVTKPTLNSSAQNPNSAPIIHNLTDFEFTKDELEVLSLGFNYAIAPRQTPHLEIISKVDPLLSKLGRNTTDAIQLANEVTYTLIQNPNIPKNLTSSQLSALNSLKSKMGDLYFLPADKGNATLILSKEQYLEKMYSHLNSGNTYKMIKKDLTTNVLNKRDKLLKELLDDTEIPKSCYTKSRNFNPISHQLYGRYTSQASPSGL